jgi:hypothetical protein
MAKTQRHSMEFGKVGDRAFGIQIKPVTAKAKFGLL